MGKKFRFYEVVLNDMWTYDDYYIRSYLYSQDISIIRESKRNRLVWIATLLTVKELEDISDIEIVLKKLNLKDIMMLKK